MTITPTIVRRSQSQLDFPAWTGDRTEFEKVLLVCRSLADDARKRALDAVDRSPEAREQYLEEESFHRSEADDSRQWDDRLARLEDSAAGGIVLSMKSVQKRFAQESVGEPSDVLAAIDKADLERVILHVGSIYGAGFNSSGYGLAVTFDVRDGVRVQITAPESDWVILGVEKLKLVLVERRPWYWPVMKEVWVGPLVAGVFALTASYSIAATGAGTATVLLGAVSAMVFGVGLGLGTNRFIRKLLPAFELLEPGSKAKGARAVGVVGGFVLWVASTIAIPILITQLAA